MKTGVDAATFAPDNGVEGLELFRALEHPAANADSAVLEYPKPSTGNGLASLQRGCSSTRAARPLEPIPSSTKLRRTMRAFEERNPTNASLAYVRGKLVELYDRRVKTRPPEMHFLTADDANDILEAWAEFPSGGSQNWRGQIFRGHAWERLPGDVPSLRPSHNGTPLARWRPRR